MKTKTTTKKSKTLRRPLKPVTIPAVITGFIRVRPPHRLVEPVLIYETRGKAAEVVDAPTTQPELFRDEVEILPCKFAGESRYLTALRMCVSVIRQRKTPTLAESAVLDFVRKLK